jgi:uncharacterized protein YdaU (DUF1376 family)
MQRPWIPFYPADYLADTQHLETAQHGAYLLLILHYWTHEGLPDDDRELARITKLPIHAWRQMRPKIEQFFNDGWRHKRIDDDLAKVGVILAKRKMAGSIGGVASAIARWRGKQTSTTAVSKRARMLKQNCKQPLTIPEEDITTTFTAAARAREKNPTISSVVENQRHESVENFPASMASLSTTTEAAAAKKNGSAISEELADLVVAKAWAQGG